MELIDYWRILIRHRILIALSTIIAIAIAAAVIIFAQPVFQAQCKILIVNTSKTDGTFDLSDLMLGTLGKSDPLTTQMEFIQTRPIFSEVIKRCHLANKDGLPATEKQIAKKTSVTAIRGSNILQLTYKDRDSSRATSVLNTIAQVAVEQNQNLNRQEIRNMREFIEIQLETQKNKLEQAEQATVNYKNKEKTVSIDLQTKSQIDAAAGIKAEIVKIESQRQGVLAQKSQVESYLAAPSAQADPFYASRLNMLEQMNNQLSNIEAQKRALYGNLSLINSKLSTLPQEEVNLFRHQRDEKVTGDLYTDLLSKYNELEIKEAAKTASIKIIEPAFSPDEPIFPKKRKLMLIALFFGMCIGYGIAYLKEFLNNTPGSISELKHVLPYAVLGTVPVLKKNTQLFMQTDLNSRAAENLRFIHANLTYHSLYHEKSLSLFITSALQEEGKALIASNLALLFSSLGKKTILVNFDLRKPLSGSMFDLQGEKGMADFLAGKASIQEIIHQGQEMSLDFIDAGSLSDHPSAILSTDRVRDFVSRIESAYDISVFIGPACTKAAETLEVAHLMKSIILVVDSSSTSMKSLKSMQDLFEGKNLPIMGTVVNKVGAGRI